MTPGPWHWQKTPGDYPETFLRTSDGEAVLAIYESHGGGAMPSPDNAKAIAALPELIEAIRFVLNDVPAPGEDAELTVKGYNALCAALEKAGVAGEEA